jgi:hypothetical protein
VGKDAALDMLVYRDALDRVSKTRDPRELTDTLTRARMTDDSALAKAVLFRGYELQNAGLVGSYFESHPDELPKWEEFMASAQEHNQLEEMGISVPLPEAPQELGNQAPQGATLSPAPQGASLG